MNKSQIKLEDKIKLVFGMSHPITMKLNNRPQKKRVGALVKILSGNVSCVHLNYNAALTGVRAKATGLYLYCF